MRLNEVAKPSVDWNLKSEAQQIAYEVCKYCSIPIVESDMDVVSLKPKQKILIEWRYDDIHNPTPASIQFKGVKGIDEDDQYNLNIPRLKLQKFLDRYTKSV